MKIRFLGTAAAEGFPGILCGCEVCRRARQRGGRNLRTRSQALINDTLLIDFPADTYLHILRDNIDLLDIQACLITHVHEDHFTPTDLHYSNGFCHPPKDWPGLTVYGSIDCKETLDDISAHTGGTVRHGCIEPFVPFTVAGCTVTALKAVHGTPHPFIYLIDDGEKTLLYAHDTGIFHPETWAYLEKARPRLALVSLDCTEAAAEDIPYDAHMCLGRNRICRDRLLALGLADSSTVWVLNHFSHNGVTPLYDDFAPIAAAEGFETSYDGMEITF